MTRPKVKRWDGERVYYLDALPGNMPCVAEVLSYNRSQMQCSPAQMRIALSELGRLAEVEAIAASDPLAKIAWEYETVYKRNSAWIAALGSQYGTDEDVDGLFRLAMEK